MKTSKFSFFGFDFTACSIIPSGSESRVNGILVHNQLPAYEDYVLFADFPSDDVDAFLITLHADENNTCDVNETIELL